MGFFCDPDKLINYWNLILLCYSWGLSALILVPAGQFLLASLALCGTMWSPLGLAAILLPMRSACSGFAYSVLSLAPAAAASAIAALCSSWGFGSVRRWSRQAFGLALLTSGNR